MSKSHVICFIEPNPFAHLGWHNTYGITFEDELTHFKKTLQILFVAYIAAHTQLYVNNFFM